MYKFGIAAALMLAALSSSLALAADLPAKAPAASSPFANGGAGWYVLFGTEAAVAQSNVSGTNLFATSLVGGDLTATGGAVNGGLGYIWGRQGQWFRFQASGGYQNVRASDNVGGASYASRYNATQEIDVGANLLQYVANVFGGSSGANLSTIFPTFEPQLPANVSVLAAPRQYFGVGIREAGVSGTLFGAGGQTVAVAPMLTTGFIWQGIDSAGKPNGTAIDMSAYVAFPVRGFTIGNAFATNGQQLTFGAAASQGTTYGAKLTLDIAIGR